MIPSLRDAINGLKPIHRLFLKFDLGDADFLLSILNDSWLGTDYSLWKIRPTSAYTDMYIYRIINSVTKAILFIIQ